MNDFFEFVYCIDKKYNKQAFLSISSLIEHSNGIKLKVNLIHKSPRSFNKYKKVINKNYPELDLNIIKNLPLLNIYGGKLTTYRKLSEKVLLDLKKYLPNAKKGPWTSKKKLA